MDTNISELKKADPVTYDGIKAWVIIIYNSNGGPPDAEYCKAFQETHGLEMEVLYDPTGASMVYGDKETSVISNELGQIVSKFHDDALSAIMEVIQDEAEAGVGQCSTQAICPEGDYCLPTPSGVGKECTQLCDADQACPDVEDSCYVYDAGNASGACFPVE